MSQNSQTTAVLLFSRSARVETQEKPLMARSRRFVQQSFYENLIGHTRAIIKEAGLPFYHIDETQQVGGSFGGRFANAFQAIYDKGYSYVIAIGNDAPDLKAGKLRQAAKELQSGKAVLGPAQDGGNYLIGIAAQAFDAETFQQIPWQTQRVNQVLESYFNRQQVSFTSLGTLTDIDHEKAIWQQPQSDFGQNLQLWLIQLLQKRPYPIQTSFQFLSQAPILPAGLRAPPYL